MMARSSPCAAVSSDAHPCVMQTSSVSRSAKRLARHRRIAITWAHKHASVLKSYLVNDENGGDNHDGEAPSKEMSSHQWNTEALEFTPCNQEGECREIILEYLLPASGTNEGRMQVVFPSRLDCSLLKVPERRQLRETCAAEALPEKMECRQVYSIEEVLQTKEVRSFCMGRGKGHRNAELRSNGAGGCSSPGMDVSGRVNYVTGLPEEDDMASTKAGSSSGSIKGSGCADLLPVSAVQDIREKSMVGLPGGFDGFVSMLERRAERRKCRAGPASGVT